MIKRAWLFEISLFWKIILEVRMDWKTYFDFLIDWKKIPAYSLEPRIDSFIGYYLRDMIPDIISKYNKEILPSDGSGVIEVIEVIPEFPIRQKTIDQIEHYDLEHPDPGERSYKVDFLIITREKPNFLVEVKSDSNYLRYKQDGYLETAKNVGLGVLMNGIKDLREASRKKIKYDHLINKLKDKNILDDDYNLIGENEDIEIIYVQPSNKTISNVKKVIIDYKKIIEWFNENEIKGEFEEYFKNALSQWVDD
jgi:acid stress-induced BolA-like protein IbaG/YrbA